MAHVLRVGSLYHPGRTSWPEAVQFTFRGGEHELLLFWPGLDVRTIAADQRWPTVEAMLAAARARCAGGA